MTLTLKTGEKVTFPTGGTLKDTLYSNSYSLIEDEDPEMARQAVLEGDGDMVDQNGKPLPPPARSKRKTRRNFVA